tara:strand:+ start:9084 stop:10259 length:1176 start_codon:yes stop_codon:yes gene_type:complete
MSSSYDPKKKAVSLASFFKNNDYKNTQKVTRGNTNGINDPGNRSGTNDAETLRDLKARAGYKRGNDVNNKTASGAPIRGGKEYNIGGSAGTTIQEGQTQGGTESYGGVTDYGQISQQFQNWKPTSDWGKAMQATYMQETLQSYNDMQQAQSMAFTNAGIQMDMMTATAALELANKGALLDAEQKAALNMMGGQFDLESKFAQDEYNRDVGKMGLGTDLNIQLMQAQGDQDRANFQVQGYEDRMGEQERGNQQRLTQAQANIEKQQQTAQAAELGMNTASFQQGLQKDSAAFAHGLGKDKDQFQQELSKDSAAFSQALSKDSSTHSSGIRKDEAQFGSGIRKDEAQFGSGIRKDELTLESDLRMKEADYANRLEARTRADQSKRSTQRARGF